MHTSRREFPGLLGAASVRAAGTNDEIGNLPSAGVKRANLEGRTVVPGFIDAHLHTASSGLRHLKDVNCDLRSISAIQAAVGERAVKTPPGGWIVGFMYDDTKPRRDGRLRRRTWMPPRRGIRSS
jgi:hypothetical protein